MKQPPKRKVAVRRRSAAASQPALLPKLAIELGPLLVFFAGNAVAGIYAGTAAFMVATLISLAVAWLRYHKVPIMPLVSGVIVLVFGGLTLYLRDETFIKLKPTIVYSMFAVLLAGGASAEEAGARAAVRPGLHAHRGGLAQAHLALGRLLRRHGGRQRARLAQFLDRCLGQLQGVRLPAAHLPVRARAGAAACSAMASRHAPKRAIPKRKSELKSSLNVIPLVRTAISCKGNCAVPISCRTGSQ